MTLLCHGLGSALGVAEKLAEHLTSQGGHVQANEEHPGRHRAEDGESAAHANTTNNGYHGEPRQGRAFGTAMQEDEHGKRDEHLAGGHDAKDRKRATAPYKQ